VLVSVFIFSLNSAETRARKWLRNTYRFLGFLKTQKASKVQHLGFLGFLFFTRDASAEHGDATVSRPSVCLSVRDV